MKRRPKRKARNPLSMHLVEDKPMKVNDEVNEVIRDHNRIADTRKFDVVSKEPVKGQLEHKKEDRIVKYDKTSAGKTIQKTMNMIEKVTDKLLPTEALVDIATVQNPELLPLSGPLHDVIDWSRDHNLVKWLTSTSRRQRKDQIVKIPKTVKHKVQDFFKEPKDALKKIDKGMGIVEDVYKAVSTLTGKKRKVIPFAEYPPLAMNMPLSNYLPMEFEEID